MAATSAVSGFFTMLYGLHYGKENSIKWLISIVISFLESLFITQPLKVRASEMQPLAMMNSPAATAGRQWKCSKELKDLGYKMRSLCPQNKSRQVICRVLLVFADINSISFISLALGLMRFLTSKDVSQNQFSWTNPSTVHCFLVYGLNCFPALPGSKRIQVKARGFFI